MQRSAQAENQQRHKANYANSHRRDPALPRPTLGRTALPQFSEPIRLVELGRRQGSCGADAPVRVFPHSLRSRPMHPRHKQRTPGHHESLSYRSAPKAGEESAVCMQRLKSHKDSASTVSGAKRRPAKCPRSSHRPRGLLALTTPRPEPTPSPHTLPEFLTLLRSHPPPALAHAPAKARTAKPASANAPEQDPAQRQNPNRLPEGDHAPPKQRRQQPVPQIHHQLAAQEDKERNPHNCRRSHEIPSFSHIQFLMLS